MNLIFSEDFNTLDTSVWNVYKGVGGIGTDYTQWSPSHVTVAGGILTIETSQDPAYGNKWVTGGISLGKTLNLTYGSFRVRFRADKADRIKYCILLWPETGWPPEIDFAEDTPEDSGVRALTTSTLHYGPNNTMIHNQVAADFTKWHTIRVDWEPGVLRYYLDGVQYAVTTGPEVPSQPMHLALQVGIHSPTSLTPASSLVQFDRVRIYQ